MADNTALPSRRGHASIATTSSSARGPTRPSGRPLEDNMTCCRVRPLERARAQRLPRRRRRHADREPATVRSLSRPSHERLTNGSGPPPRGSKATGPTHPWLKGIL